MKWIRKKIIYGCDGRGDGDSRFLTRWTLLSIAGFTLCLHLFHRSDADVMHDHPWPFITCILWRGYVEHYTDHDRIGEPYPASRRLLPGMIQYRPAQWAHRVQLIDERPALTLIFRGRIKREWGFHTRAGWMRWKEYLRSIGCHVKED